MVAVGSRMRSLYTIVDFLVFFSGSFLNDFDDLFDASVGKDRRRAAGTSSLRLWLRDPPVFILVFGEVFIDETLEAD